MAALGYQVHRRGDLPNDSRGSARPAFDLDNFAKPVLDTLFTSQNVSRLTGELLPGVNDTCVCRLLLEKVEVKTPQEQGADITVTWHSSVTPDLSTS